MNDHEKSVEAAKTAIKAKGMPDFSKIAPNDTEEDGLYMAEDDEGESYYYRGAVKNNYVSFAGFIWRIIRRNGDGSVRLIYSGKSPSDTGETVTILNSRYSSEIFDPTYAGYKYNEKFSLHENNGTTGYNGFTNTQKYNFGTGYSFDESTKKFILTGNIQQLTWKYNHGEIVSSNLYSCLNTSCSVVYKVTGYQSDYMMTVQPISYSSASYVDAVTNTTDSHIKRTIDNWYKNNLISYASYLADETFCNDRSVTGGSGYLMASSTYYGTYKRLYTNREPSLKCVQDNDKFKVLNTRAKLEYPIALITADEVAMAGGVIDANKNYNYYLCNGRAFWTLSPSYFNSINSLISVWSVRSTGDLNPWTHPAYQYEVRPVISLKSDIQIINGDGSTLNPYVVKIL